MRKIKFFQSQQFGLGLLLMVMVVWGTTFPLMKDAITTISPSALAAVRFSIAAAVLLPFLRKLNPQLIFDGAVLGIIFFLTLFTQLKGLETIPANRAAFICGFNVVLVPLLSPWFRHWFANSGRTMHRTAHPNLLPPWFRHRFSQKETSPREVSDQKLANPLKPQKWTAAIMAFTGLGIMFGGAASWSIGDLWMLLCALAITLYLLYLELVSSRHQVMALSGVQLLAIAIISLIWAAPNLGEQAGAIASHGWLLVYLGIVVSVLSTCLQTIAQRLVSAQDTALMCTLEPVFATIFAFLLLGEQLTIQGWLGAGVVLVAMCHSQDLLPFLGDRALRNN
jgi:drug/metabolite transporter (DMT)-like permease